MLSIHRKFLQLTGNSIEMSDSQGRKQNLIDIIIIIFIKIKIIFIIIIIKNESAIWCNTYQSDNPNPTKLTHGGRKNKIAGDKKANSANKKDLALLFKPVIPTPSTLPVISFHKDTERGTNVLWY